MSSSSSASGAPTLQQLTDLLVSAVRDIARLMTTVDSLSGRVQQVEVRPSISTTTVPTPSTHASRRARRRERAALRKAQAPAPTPAATSAARIASATVPPSLPQAALEKIVVTLSVPDAVAGHVVGRAGTGLRQIHDISHAKVSIAQAVGPSASRAVTIRGTSREVGDAISAIGKRIARRRVRQPKTKKSKGKTPVHAGPSASTTATPTPRASTSATPRPVAPATPRVPAPASTPAPVAPSAPSTGAASSPSPMSGVQSAGSPTPSIPSGSPMQIDSASASGSSRPRQTARRGGAPVGSSSRQ